MATTVTGAIGGSLARLIRNEPHDIYLACIFVAAAIVVSFGAASASVLSRVRGAFVRGHLRPGRDPAGGHPVDIRSADTVRPLPEVRLRGPARPDRGRADRRDGADRRNGDADEPSGPVGVEMIR